MRPCYPIDITVSLLHCAIGEHKAIGPLDASPTATNLNNQWSRGCWNECAMMRLSCR